MDKILLYSDKIKHDFRSVFDLYGMDKETERTILLNEIRSNRLSFSELSLRMFEFQYQYNPLYKKFCNYLNRTPSNTKELWKIPFLPIEFFKSQKVRTGNFEPEVDFRSSGTGFQRRSIHMIRDAAWYRENSVHLFEAVYGPLDQFVILALLPSYLEQRNSSLVFMVEEFMERSDHQESRFYRYDFESLKTDLERLRTGSRKILLWGVSFALVDFAEKYPMDLDGAVIMETGGMKGRRREWIRSELHDFLKERLRISSVHSEYGMAELLSQFYAPSEGLFRMNERARVLAFEISDPLSPVPSGHNGRCHIIDLANIDSCCFIATEDVCRIMGPDAFEIAGRLDHTEMRGCNLMYL